MRIGKETIPGLTQKNTAGGLRYYWQPSPVQRAAKWAPLALGADLAAAIAAAKRRNEEVEDWKMGGARPRAVARFVKAATFDALLTRYEREVLVTKAESTQRVDRTAIKRLRIWAGDQPVAFITRARVKVLRNEMMRHATLDGPGHAVAFHTLTTLRKIMTWWIDDTDAGIDNPADRFGLAMPAPRDQVWEKDDLAAFCTAAAALGWHSVAMAARLAYYIGQREGDLLALTRQDWQEVTNRQLRFDQATFDALKSDHGPDAGKVMGIRIKQSKTGRHIGVPIEGDMRAEIEAAIAAATARARDTGALAAARILAHDGTGQPWRQREFIERIAEARDAAIAVAIMDGDTRLADRLDQLQFRDLRRTCVVTLGELGLDDPAIAAITGHKLETIKRILETYMPRTEAMAARGVIARIGQRPAVRDEAKEQSA